MADTTLTTEVIDPSITAPAFVDSIDPSISAMGAWTNKTGQSLRDWNFGDIAAMKFLIGDDVRAVAQGMINKGLGNYSPGNIVSNLNDAGFVQQYGLGKTSSYSDLAKEALSTNPAYDPNDITTLNQFATDIKTRGLTNQNREDIRTLATNQTVKSAIDKATNPQNYLTDQQKTENLNTAGGLLKTIYGNDYQDTEGLTQFLADRIAEGESSFELAQFLKTTPDYQKKQADIENARVQSEAASAREALNQELLRGEQEAFERATPSIISSYQKAGRLTSSSLDAALANARKQLESERQSFLGNAAYQDAIRSQGYNRENFVNNQGAAWNQYLRQNEPAYQQRFAVQNAGNQLAFQQPYNDLSRYYSLSDQTRQRQWELEDYAAQQSDFYRALGQNRKSQREAALWGLGGSVLGAGLQGLASNGFKI